MNAAVMLLSMNIMNPAERKRKSRQKLKANAEKLEEFLKQERLRDAKRRKKNKETIGQNEEAKALWREKERERKRKARAKKKVSIPSTSNQQLMSSPLGSYKSVRTLRKAVIRTQKSLPESPSKQQAVLMELTKVIPKPIFSEYLSKRQRHLISDEDRKKAQSFYERDDISRAAPGRKDTISVKNQETGIRTHVAKRHMVMSIAEAFALFKEKHPDVTMGKSFFYDMRPVHVRPMSEMPHNVCVCIHHANYNFLVEALHKLCDIFPATSTEVLEEICCDCTNEACMTSACKKCFDIYDIVPEKYDVNMMVSWKQWTKSENRLEVAHISGTVTELLQELQTLTPKFKQHVFIKRRQSEAFQTQKLLTTNEEILLQVDFAENFAILSQDEIQSAHWSHPQVTIFTGCAWAGKGDSRISYLILSNELSHDKYAVWAFLKKIVEDLKTEYPSLKKLHIFTDGCAAQFKNRYILSNICWSKEDFGIEMQWNFFATSHGKGAVDGVGATAKQSLWNAIMSRRAIINTSWDCYNWLKNKQLKATKVYFVGIDDISFNKENLDKRWTDMQSIPYIQKQHTFRAFSNKCLSYALTAKSQPKKILLLQEGKLSYNDVYSESDDENVIPLTEPKLSNRIEENASIDNNVIKIGTYLLVKLEADSGRKHNEYKYLAVSQNPIENNDELKVMFLKSINTGKTTFRIDENDVSYIKRSQILNILPEPIIKATGDRIYYEFQNPVDISEKK